MSIRRRIAFTLLALILILSGFWVYLHTFGMNLKGTETRSMDVARNTIETLQDNGVIEADLQPDKVWELSRTIKQPIEDQIFITQQDYMWAGWWMPFISLVLLVLTWWPGRKPKEVQ